MSRLPLAVTTSANPSPGLVAMAQEKAAGWQLPYVPRPRKSSLRPLLEQFASALLVFGAEGMTLWDSEGPLRFAEGLARLRLRRLDAGLRDDLLIRVAELRPGDSVLDCTLGLAQDAMVAARAVGERGRVVGVEKSFGIYALVSEGLKAHPHACSCPIETFHGDSLEYLTGAHRGAFDCVVLDPMFERPGRGQPSFEALRRHAEGAGLKTFWIAQARKAARRAVLVKARCVSSLRAVLEDIPAELFEFRRVAWARVPGLNGRP